MTDKVSAHISQAQHPRGKYMVMRYSSNLRRMHCSAVHATYQDAYLESQRLYVQSLEEGSDPARIGFYILRIVDRIGSFSGGPLELGGTES